MEPDSRITHMVRSKANACHFMIISWNSCINNMSYWRVIHLIGTCQGISDRRLNTSANLSAYTPILSTRSSTGPSSSFRNLRTSLKIDCLFSGAASRLVRQTLGNMINIMFRYFPSLNMLSRTQVL